jgi:hypothetical protein
MKRFDIINHLIEKHAYQSYLEVGTQGDYCISRVICPKKVGIDPKPVIESHDYTFYKMTSDEFFKSNTRTFDCIFIDGLHYCTQTFKDIYYSLKVLNDKGTIVVHDCNPSSEVRQIVPEKHLLGWNGDVWKAWIAYRNNPNLRMMVFDLDEGVGIIQRGKQYPLGIRTKMVALEYNDLEENRQQWLNLVEFDINLL